MKNLSVGHFENIIEIMFVEPGDLYCMILNSGSEPNGANKSDSALIILIGMLCRLK
jgi:hypothetical protein